MDAAGSLALVVLGIIIGWIIELVIDFTILRPYWITQGRESAPPGEPDQDELFAQVAEMQAAQSDVIKDISVALERLNTEQSELIERTAFDDGPLRHVLEDIIVTLEKHESMLEHLEALDGQLASTAEVLSATLSQQIGRKLDTLTDAINAYEAAPPAAPQGPLIPTTTPTPISRPLRSDRLTDIRGIGSSYADRLQLAGIHTFDQLAALNPDELSTLLNMRGTEKIAKWIEQARGIVQSRSKIEGLR